MKKSILLSVIAAFLAINVNAQSDFNSKLWDFNEWQKNIVVTSKVDEAPKFESNEKALFHYFDNKIQMSKKIKCKDFYYRIFCIVDIDENGKITNVTFKDSWFLTHEYHNYGEIHNEKNGFDFINNQILTIIKDMPNWTPAKLNGKNVASTIKFPIQYEYKNKNRVKPVKVKVKIN